MAKPNLSSILDRPSEDAERPKPIPQGTYICTVQSWEEGSSTKKQTPFIRFILKPIDAGEDVNAEDLEEAGGLGERTIATTYYLTDNSEYRLREFLDHCGVDAKNGKTKLTHRERSEMALNTQVGAFIKHRASEDGEAVFAEVSRTHSVE
jgi:hypothetical protein